MYWDELKYDEVDAVFGFDVLKVFVGQTRLLYIDRVEVDYVERLNDAGIKFTHGHGPLYHLHTFDNSIAGTQDDNLAFIAQRCIA